MDLLQWIAAEHASVATRFERSIAAIVPAGRWRDPAGAGGSSIAYLLYHTTVHAVQWEAIGHRLNHLGEMVSVRNRLGLSPF